MRCNACNTALGYNLLMQWYDETIHAEDFEHPCPFCGATLYIHLELEILFDITTFPPSRCVPP